MSFDQAEKTLEWARAALMECVDAHNKWTDEKHFYGVEDFDPISGHFIRSIVIKDNYPISTFERKANEAIVNGKHVYDQAAFAAHLQVTGKPPRRGGNFPWSDSEVGLVKILDKRSCPEILRQVYLDFGFYSEGAEYGSRKKLVRKMAALANKKHSLGFALFAKADRIEFENISVLGQAWFLPEGNGYFKNNELQVVRFTERNGVEFDMKTVVIQPAFEQESVFGGEYVMPCIDGFLQGAGHVIEVLKDVSRTN
ncbi:hypothetical protein [Profundibacter sp.]